VICVPAVAPVEVRVRVYLRWLELVREGVAIPAHVHVLPVSGGNLVVLRGRVAAGNLQGVRVVGTVRGCVVEQTVVLRVRLVTVDLDVAAGCHGDHVRFVVTVVERELLVTPCL